MLRDREEMSGVGEEEVMMEALKNRREKGKKNPRGKRTRTSF